MWFLEIRGLTPTPSGRFHSRPVRTSRGCSALELSFRPRHGMPVNKRRSSRYYYYTTISVFRKRWRATMKIADDDEDRWPHEAYWFWNQWGGGNASGRHYAQRLRLAAAAAPIVRHSDIVPTRTYTKYASCIVRGARRNSADLERGRFWYIFHPLRVVCVCVKTRTNRPDSVGKRVKFRTHTSRGRIRIAWSDRTVLNNNNWSEDS